MWKVATCLGCLKTGVKFVSIDKKHLRKYYNALTGLTTNENNEYSSYLCIECATLVLKFKNFQQKCHRAYFTLQELHSKNNEFNVQHVAALNLTVLGLSPNLSYSKLQQMYYQEIVCEQTKQTEESICSTNNNGNIQTFKFNTYEHLVKNECFERSESPKFYDFNDDYSNDSKVDVKFENKCEFAFIKLMSRDEAVAVHGKKIKKSKATKKLGCYVCGKHYDDVNVLNSHVRMHDKLLSGPYYCDICQCYFKSDKLLTNHTNAKHKYKYTCPVCGDVNYQENKAKLHFALNAHKFPSKTSSEKQTKTKKKSKYKYQRKKLSIALPPHFKRITVSQADQYKEVEERKNSKNYIESVFTCELCYRGFRGATTLSNHMKKHDTSFAGPIECDMCKLHFKNTRKLYKHMIIAHLYKYACQICDFVTSGASQAHGHNRWHDNVTYKCDFCDQSFNKQSTRLSHIRIKHPSTILCAICGQGFVSAKGLYFHQKRTHTNEEMETSCSLVTDKSSPSYCLECDIQFLNKEAFDKHLGSSVNHTTVNTVFQNRRTNSAGSKVGRETKQTSDKPKRKRRSHDDIVNSRMPTSINCDICGEYLPTEQKAIKHFKDLHPGVEYMKRYMCDQCGHATKQYANLLVHMRRHTREKPYSCPHCDKKFSMASNRDRHIVVHTGERPYECEHCHRRFTQSWAAKLHIQTVHLKIPYKPWEKASRKRRQKLAQAKLLQTSSIVEEKFYEEPITAGNLINTFFME